MVSFYRVAKEQLTQVVRVLYQYKKVLETYYLYQWWIGVQPRIDTVEGRLRWKRLQYSVYGREYAMMIAPPRGPVPYEWISHVEQNEDDSEPPEITDVTDELLVYMGPYYDFHGSASRLTPFDLGYTGTLVFRRFGGDDKIYIGKDDTFQPLTVNAPPSPAPDTNTT